MAIASGICGRRNEQGEEARGETAHVLHGAKVFDVWISLTARGTWNSEFARFNLGKEESRKVIWYMTIPTLTKINK